MRFEKLNEDKIRITLSNEDLLEKDIDFHSFMADSIESQDLFFDCLKEAEKQIGFVTKNYSLRIETIAMSSGDFVLTITRSMPEKNKKNIKKKIHIKKNIYDVYNTQAVYAFDSFDDYCDFICFFRDNNFKTNNLADAILLFENNNIYYLVLHNINLSYPNLKKLLYTITEFSSFVNNSDLFSRKLFENGNLIMKNNALKLTMKYF